MREWKPVVLHHSLQQGSLDGVVNSDLFIHKFYEKEPQSMAKLVHSTQNFMNAEDAIIAKKRKRAERIEANSTRHSKQAPRPKKGRMEDKKDRDNKKLGSSARNQ